MGEFYSVETEGYLDDMEKPHEACGVFGVFAPGEPVATIAFAGIQELQHRGQSGAGLYVYDTQDGFVGYRGNGLIADAIPEAIPHTMTGLSPLDEMTTASLAIGHTRYSTSESNEACQPFMGNRYGIALAHNGHIDEMDDIILDARLSPDEHMSDSHALALILDKRADELGDLSVAMKELFPKLEGGYCLVISDGKRLIAVRDPWGFHPLALGVLPNDKGIMVASEAQAFKHGGYVRDIAPGEIVTIDENGVHSQFMDREESPAACAYEHIYFARRDGTINGVKSYRARKNLGKYLAIDHAVEADIVVGVPDSGAPAAVGYADESGIRERSQAIFRDPYTKRTFIERDKNREAALRSKFHPNSDELTGQRVVLVDDSLIKGNTMRTLIRLLRDAGATEVHVRLSAPRYTHPCYMGMDTGNTKELLASRMSDEEICQYIGADSIGFNSVERVTQSIEEAVVDPVAAAKVGGLCTACCTGKYPIQLSESRLRPKPQSC